jgi:undecaprenyl-diphosphatase
VGTVATGVVGFCLRKSIEPLFASPSAVGIALLVTGTVLWLTSYRKGGPKEVAAMGFWDALWVGVAQGVALIPGISRSGLTISVGLFRGLRRELSGTFSFLLMIPATIGALGAQWALPAKGHSPRITIVLVGTVVAFLTGYVSLRVLLNLIEKGKFCRFAYYCWAMGGLALVLGGRP